MGELARLPNTQNSIFASRNYRNRERAFPGSEGNNEIVLLTSGEGDSIVAGVVEVKHGTVGCAVTVSIKLFRDWALLLTFDDGNGADTGGCCFFFKASCRENKTKHSIWAHKSYSRRTSTVTVNGIQEQKMEKAKGKLYH